MIMVGQKSLGHTGSDLRPGCRGAKAGLAGTLGVKHFLISERTSCSTTFPKHVKSCYWVPLLFTPTSSHSQDAASIANALLRAQSHYSMHLHLGSCRPTDLEITPTNSTRVEQLSATGAGDGPACCNRRMSLDGGRHKKTDDEDSDVYTRLDINVPKD